ncbi:MAG TPA: SPOR domain-containing protein [Rhizomicrobium sp.]
MANYERRGVYEPNDEVRVFDGAEDDEDVEGSRLPLLIVLALLVLAMFGGVVWLAYTQGVARGRGETPVLTAAAGPEKVAPQQPGGANVPYQGFKIYEQPAPPDDVADTAPEAAKPAPAATPAQKPAPVAAAPVEAPKPAPAPVTAPPPFKPAQMAAATPAPVMVKPAPVKPVVAPPAAHPAAAAPAPKSMAALIQQSNSAPAAPMGGPAMGAPHQLSGSATGAPHQLATPATAKVAAATPAAAKSSGGGYVLQIGSYKSQADADASWKAYKGKHAALLSGYNSDVQQADLGEKGTWYRLRVGGLADKEVAAALCERLKADGGACILGR